MMAGFDRRTFLKRAGQVGGLVVAGGTVEPILAACGGNVATPTSTGTQGETKVASNGVRTPGILSWGSDYVDGAPYVFKDPTNPAHLVGFEVDVANAIGRVMGITARQAENDYGQLEQALLANKFDAVLNGWEITADRQKTELFSDPYYRYGQQIVVRADDSRFTNKSQSDTLSLKDLEGLNVGTGTGYKAADILATDSKIKVKLYDTNLPFDDLAQRKIDAVMIDLPPVAYYVLGSGPGGQPNKALKLIGKPLFPDNYVIGLNKSNPKAQTLVVELNQALAVLKKDGTLKQIYQRWSMWNDQQADIGIK